MRSWTVHTARLLATFAHDGQTDAAGNAYIGHPAAVARLSRLYAAEAGLDPDLAEMVGWLHDVPEDTRVTFSDLRRFGCPEEVIEPLYLLTRRPQAEGDDYYVLIRRHPYALVVKRADVHHNSLPMRLAEVAKIDPARAERLRAKYEHAKEVLGG